MHAHPPSTTTSLPFQHETLKEAEKEKCLERNIDAVLFGDILFKAWYPSWYPKEVLGEKGLEGKGEVVRRLYVCKRCFGYTKVCGEFLGHVRGQGGIGTGCGRRVPGRRVYIHGAGGVEGKEEMGMEGIGRAHDGGWEVWEVDGAVDTIFSQNLSLFAKLFLDNKSVLFDVSSFLYYLLVHVSPRTSTRQIAGFFSKEKMSWDSNNLACILIFPPWQRKGLGTLLMGVSYEISRREEILGGPEKPISELGRKGYRRFWGAEIARWLLERRETDRTKGKGMISVEDVSKGTWIAQEDCLGVLREMGIVERSGREKGKVDRMRIDKKRIREWIEKEGLSLERVVDPEGFVDGHGHGPREGSGSVDGDEEGEEVDGMDVDVAENNG